MDPAHPEALQLFTQGSSGFSGESGHKNTIAAGQLADVCALSADFFTVPEEAIKSIEALPAIVDGKVVFASEEFGPLDPPAVPVLPEWSPPRHFGGYGAPLDVRKAARAGVPMPHAHDGNCRRHGCNAAEPHDYSRGFWGGGCDCFAF